MSEAADFWQAQELHEREQWECVYCGRPVPQGTQSEMHLCCGEVGHTTETEGANE